MNLFRTTSHHLLAGTLALAAFSPWTPLSLSTAPADAQHRTKTHPIIKHNNGHTFRLGHQNRGSRGFSRSRHRSFGSRFNRSFGGSSFNLSLGNTSFRTGSHLSSRSDFHAPRTVIIQRAHTPHFSTLTEPSYPVTAGPTARDAWTHLSAGRNTQAQQIFGLLAGASPTQATPKVGYGLAALLRGDDANAERALIRAHQANPDIWQILRQQPEARAAALDLLQRPHVQATETLRTAMTLLAQAPPAPASAEHDYGIDAPTP